MSKDKQTRLCPFKKIIERDYSGKTGKTLVVFDPDEDMQEAIKKFIPRSLKFEKFGRG